MRKLGVRFLGGVLLGFPLSCGDTTPPSSCPAGTAACPTGCADLQRDAANCGECGTVCPAGNVCTAGSCVASGAQCPTGTVACGDLGCVAPSACVPSDDGCPLGTRDCGNGCVAVAACLPESGVCPEGTLDCGEGGCTDPMTSKVHCGRCNYACNGADLTCTDGVCHLPCDEGQPACGGVCTDTRGHVLHCSACHQSCPPLSECSQSQCVGGPGERQLNGYYPTTVDLATAYKAFDFWRTQHTEDCGGGLTRVKFDSSDETVSEGIGYGLLLAAGWGDRALFDSMLNYHQAVVKSNGLMPWKLNGCTRSVVDQGSATDGDLDIAMALLMADCMWPDSGYWDFALRVIEGLRQETIVTDGSRLFLIAGDGWGTADPCGNPSYFAPGYYRAFAAAGVPGAADWTKLAQDTYYYLNKAANPSTGLVSEWMANDSRPCSQGTGAYSYNAARTPWRVMTDFAWWGDAQARQLATTIGNWVAGIGIANVVDGYTLAGAAQGQWKNSTFTGAFALTGIAASQERADQFHAEWLDAIPQDMAYFNASLRAIYLLLSVGRFIPGCY